MRVLAGYGWGDMPKSDPRSLTPLDLPLVRRLMPQRLPLDMSTALTRGNHGMEDAVLFSMPLTDLGAPTLVMRNGESGYVGQFRHRAGDPVAHLTFLSPEPQEGDMHDWTRLLEAIAFEAGKRGAHLINAEVAEDHPVFVSFRMAGFAVYSRQVIMRRHPAPVPAVERNLLRPEASHDAFAISTLHANTVPRLLQQADPLPGADGNGLVYERDGQMAGYLAVIEGKAGIVIKPYFHPEVYEQAPAIIASALAVLPRAAHLPVFLYARAYQDWLRGALEQVEFEPWINQALMVKYTLVRAERAELVSLPGLEPNHLRPPVVDRPLPVHKRTSRQHTLNRESWLALWRRPGRRLRQHEPYGTPNNR